MPIKFAFAQQDRFTQWWILTLLNPNGIRSSRRRYYGPEIISVPFVRDWNNAISEMAAIANGAIETSDHYLSAVFAVQSEYSGLPGFCS